MNFNGSRVYIRRDVPFYRRCEIAGDRRVAKCRRLKRNRGGGRRRNWCGIPVFFLRGGRVCRMVAFSMVVSLLAYFFSMIKAFTVLATVWIGLIGASPFQTVHLQPYPHPGTAGAAAPPI